MDQDQGQQQIKKYLDLLLRKKKLIMASFLIVVTAVLAWYLKTPKVYQATSLIMYQQQKVSPSKMSPDEMKRIGEMVSTVSQQVTSRTSLEAIIKQFNLYQSYLQKLPLEDVIDIMRRKHISIQSPKDTGDVFSVSFQGIDPKKVMLVTNALAAKFIEENLRFREERAAETSAYIKDELSMSKKAIDKKEAIMRDYKLKYYNEMPEQRQANIARLNALQEQYQANQSNTHNLEQTRILLQEQISLRKDMLSQAIPKKTDASSGLSSRTSQSFDEIYDLNTARNVLESLLNKYTDQHPDVKRLKNRIRKLEESQTLRASSRNELSSGQEDDQAAQNNSLDFSIEVGDPQLEQQALQLKEIALNLARLEKERVDIQKQIKEYQQWIDAVPVREAEWASLTRDYDEFKKHYEYLVAQSLAAESAESLERRQKGSQFKIVDPAYLPEKPIKPDFMKIMLIAVVVGLGAGGGLVLILESLDTSFKSVADLESFLGMQVVCSVPAMSTDKEKRQEKMTSILWSILFAALFLFLGGGVSFLWWKGFIVI